MATKSGSFRRESWSHCVQFAAAAFYGQMISVHSMKLGVEFLFLFGLVTV